MEGRTSRYCTGPWKAIDAPIIHVNGDDPDACLRAADFAVTFRQTHGRDVVIDLVCYRRNGHNELDEPRFTQPLAYDAIDGHVPVRSSFEDELVTRGALSRHQIDEAADRYRQRLEEAFTGADQWRPNISVFPNGRWADFRPGLEPAAEPETGIGEDRLKALLDRFATPPPDMRLNSKVEKLIRQRRDAEGRGASWSIAEGLAFASLLTEGVPVRLSGEDAIRGTFSSQHFGVVDIKTGRRLSTLEEIVRGQAPFTILNSPLIRVCRARVRIRVQPRIPRCPGGMGGSIRRLRQWRADHHRPVHRSRRREVAATLGAGNARPARARGAGPEHSSARPERYLQLAARNNIQVANPSTPANYFHLLRRQVLRSIRKPLIVFTPKSLLRLSAAFSPLTDFGEGRQFEPILSSPGTGKATRLLLCNGKIAYDLERERTERDAEDVRVVRLEMIYPLASERLAAVFAEERRAEIPLGSGRARKHGRVALDPDASEAHRSRGRQ